MRLVRTTAVVVAILALTASAASPVFSNRISPFPSGKRGFCFKNSCSFPIRVGHTGASTGIPCGEGCPPGTICNGPVGFCYFSMSDQIKAIPTLQPKSDRVCIEINYPTVETRMYMPTGVVKLHVTFSGTLYGSTGCDAGGYCQTAICHDCPSYVGPNGAMMQAEMTLQDTDQDYYDVTAIHGSNAPMVMKPLSPDGTFYTRPEAVQEYLCGEPGTPTPMRGEKVSTWQYRPSTATGGVTHYALVSNTGIPCSASCKDTCGMAQVIGGNGQPTADVVENTCGKLLGVWSDNMMCGWTDANKFGLCKDNVANAEKGGNHQQAFECAGPYADSCFQRTATAGCCGCTVWPELDLPYDKSNPCWAISQGWMETVKPRIQFLKEACPTCYTYAYDDATSLFVCRSPETQAKNMISYEIEWCPSGIELTVEPEGTPITPVPSPQSPTPTPSTAAPTPKPSTPAPATPKPATPVPATPTPAGTPKPATPAPATPKPVTPAPATPTPSSPTPATPKPATPVPATPTPATPTPVTAQPTPDPFTWAPVSPTPAPPVTPAPVTQKPTANPFTWAPITPTPATTAPTAGPATPSPQTPQTAEPPQAASGDKSAAQNNGATIALGVIAVILAVIVVAGVTVGIVFRKKLFGDDTNKATEIPSSPNGPRSPGMSYEEDPGAASTEPLPA